MMNIFTTPVTVNSIDPAEYRSLECICEKTGPDDPMILTYSRERGFFEPITNRAAEPVVGKVLSWKYRYPDKKDW